MKNFFSYTLIIFLSGFFIFTGVKNKKLSKSINQNYTKSNIKNDTITQKLPEGHPYITNFNPAKNKKIKSISQDSMGVMLFLTGKGIIFFDGKSEKDFFIDNNPNILKKDKKLDQFYIAGRKGFGIVKKDKTGNYIYKSISGKTEIDDNYKDIVVGENKIWFLSNHKIVSINPKDYEIYNVEHFDKNKNISGAFTFNNKLYFSLYKSGLHFIDNNSVIQLINDSLFSNSEIVFSSPNKGSIIIGTGNNKLYSFNGKTYTHFKTSSDDYIKESIITGGLNFSENELIVTTLNGGALLINKETGKTSKTINYRTGLPDDEIFAALRGKDGGLWLSHDYGISRVAFEIPVTNYGLYPGLQGKINCVKVHDSILYVATGEGLYFLSDIKDYNEVEVATKKWVRSEIKYSDNNSSSNNKVSEPIYSSEENNVESEDDSFLSRWKRRRNKKKQENESVEENIDKEIVVEPDDDVTETHPVKKSDSYKTIYKSVIEYKKIYELQSVKHTYKKITGINNKCKHLKVFSNGLLASTNSGLFYIEGETVQTLIPDAYIYNISGNGKTLFSATSKGIFRIKKLNNNIKVEKINDEIIKDKKFNKIFKINDSTFFGNTSNYLFLLKIKDLKILSSYKFKIDIDNSNELNFIKENNRIIIFTSSNSYFYNEELNDVLKYSEFNKILRKSDNIFPVTDTSIIITNNNILLKEINAETNNNILKYVWLFENIEKIIIDNNNNIWVVSQNNSIFKISDTKTVNDRKFELFITDITDNTGKSFKNKNRITLEGDYKNINVGLSSPAFLKKGFVSYLYGIDNDNPESYIGFSSSKIVIPKLTDGEHIIYFQAINDLNEKSKILKIHISIKPPFWQTKIFIIIVFFVILVLISIVISAFYRRKQRKIKQYNEILEQKVKERTAEIEKQNGQIQTQNNEIYEQYQKIDCQNKEITGSIRYASKIQKAALPNIDIQEKYLSGFFNLYKPRDIVSGDFYWIKEAQNKLFIAAVDCTGHGVPGGFLSMLGISFLNEIVIDLDKKKKYIRAADILNILREKVISTLSQQGDSITRDGMDMALAVIDKEKKLLNFAGANNPAYIIRENQLTKIDADRMPIGYTKNLNEIKFKDKFIKILKNDTIYIFSDGYADQFGGKLGRKFNARRFRELLLHIQKYPMAEQKTIAESVLKKWKQDEDQIDDILLIGLKI